MLRYLDSHCSSIDQPVMIGQIVAGQNQTRRCPSTYGYSELRVTYDELEGLVSRVAQLEPDEEPATNDISQTLDQRFAARLPMVRAFRGMTQAELARKAVIGVSYVSRLEGGLISPGLDLLDRLARSRGITILAER